MSSVTSASPTKYDIPFSYSCCLSQLAGRWHKCDERSFRERSSRGKCLVPLLIMIWPRASHHHESTCRHLPLGPPPPELSLQLRWRSKASHTADKQGRLQQGEVAHIKSHRIAWAYQGSYEFLWRLICRLLLGPLLQADDILSEEKSQYFIGFSVVKGVPVRVSLSIQGWNLLRLLKVGIIPCLFRCTFPHEDVRYSVLAHSPTVSTLGTVSSFERLHWG